MVIKRKAWIIGISIIAIILASIFVIFRSSEDTWVKNSRGIYVMHGNPLVTPSYVKDQQQALDCVNGLYSDLVKSGAGLSSQCMGTCGDYAVDIVHVPRTAEDDLPANQCNDYRIGTLKHFIEIDKNGLAVRIV